ncbi:MAG: tRNA (adenosine(37)-N6)-threonylcarbamoyltransferase complex ATPase subunit type 1 TsaE [Thiomargarita sp.]|nr:tRNA (adenosine(37)-N6)-threonylcarbamoyltransferase complex ATPase subunit type 1 TsaE [Thiomargarita sp.]
MLIQDELGIFIANASEMEAFGGKLAQACCCYENSIIIHLNGELGVGKTTLTRGFLSQLGHQGTVKSPTYTIVEPYQIGKYHIYHFDFYRLIDPEELEYLGIRDYSAPNTIFLIEWAEKGGELAPIADLQVDISYNLESRLLKLKTNTEMGKVIKYSINGKKYVKKH